MKKICDRMVHHPWFALFINLVIVTNCALIGVETYVRSEPVVGIQRLCLLIFTAEIALRFVAAESLRSFFRDGWNIFDLTLVLISFVPESIFSNSATVTALRILRVFRVLRLIRTSIEIKLIIGVLIRSCKALTYNALFFMIFMYLFGIVGVTIFKLPAAETATPELRAALAEYHAVAPGSPAIAPDPYGNLHEAMFTLFRVTTGDDWTDLRYNLLEASKRRLVHVPSYVVTMFHVIWFSLSAFLLLNLVVGAVVNNYQVIMEEMKMAAKSG